MSGGKLKATVVVMCTTMPPSVYVGKDRIYSLNHFSQSANIILAQYYHFTYDKCCDSYHKGHSVQ